MQVDENETLVHANASRRNSASNEQESMDIELMAQKYNEIQGQQHVICAIKNIRELTNNTSGFGEGTSSPRKGACRQYEAARPA